MRLRQALSRLGSAFWTVPVAGAVLALVVGWLVSRLDQSLGGDTGLLFGGGPDSARAILQTVATSVLTFAGLTFSITVVALQLASSRFSPRVLGPLMRDRWTQAALGTFVGTFVYCLMVLREVQGDTSRSELFVPGLGVSLALRLALVSIGALVGFIQHIAQSLRVVTIIERIFRDTAATLDAWYDGPPATGTIVRTADARVLTARRDGVLAWYDRKALVALATEHDLTLEVPVPAGSWVVAGRPLLRVYAPSGADRTYYTSPWFEGGHRIMVPFGCTCAPYYSPDPRCSHEHGFHHGIDVAMPCGTPLYARFRARVAPHDALGPAYGDHPVLLRSRKRHLDLVIGHTEQVYAEPGEVVHKGEMFARANDQGAPDGCHLHFEQRAVRGDLSTAVRPRHTLRLTSRRR